jgi:hypothetical protein
MRLLWAQKTADNRAVVTDRTNRQRYRNSLSGLPARMRRPRVEQMANDTPKVAGNPSQLCEWVCHLTLIACEAIEISQRRVGKAKHAAFAPHERRRDITRVSAGSPE